MVFNLMKFVLLAGVIHTARATSTCGPNFGNKCFCGEIEFEGNMRYVVNCTDTGFQNTNVLEYMPEETQVLIFTGNYITELPWNVFGAINDYSSLTVIDMSNNHIREIRGKSYHHVQNVKRLMLSHNNLSISRFDDELNHHHPRVFSNFINLESLHLTNAFADNTSAELSKDLHDIFQNSNLSKLMKLHLEQNEISHFKDRKVFCDLPSLRDLHLGDNNLKEINFDVLCLKNLRFLDLERNKFENVKIRDLSLLDTLESTPGRDIHLIVDFGLNPFVCDCKLNPFHEWLKITPVTVRSREDLMCFKNKVDPVQIIAMSTQKCGVQSQKHKVTTGHTVTLIFLLVTLSFILIALVSALIYVSRDRIKYIIAPALDAIPKKVQYTSIKDDDCPEVHV